MSAQGLSPIQVEEALAADISAFAADPLGYAMYAYDWDRGELAGKLGPREWQADILNEMGNHLQNPEIRFDPLLIAVASGHGIGKSALISIIIDWAMGTGVDTKVIVTANTATQLGTKTWPEISKWRRLSIINHWFKTTATSVTSLDEEHTASWRADAVPWSEHNTEAFAGAHNEGKRLVLIFDEASNISDKVWEVAEGALTDANTEIIWIAFGNPTRNSGRFRDCFYKFKHRWIRRQVDARTVEGTNHKQHQKWVDDYGEDSDFVRVRVRGMFPRASALQLIPTDWVAEAMRREATSSIEDALVCGIDIARGGDDNNVIRFRRGLDARSIDPIVIPGSETRDTTLFIAKVCQVVKDNRPDAVFVDSTGVGGPVADQLRRLMPNVPIYDVNFASKAPDAHYTNMRTYMWWQMRESLRAGLAIDDNNDMEAELTSPEYFHMPNDQLALEKKADIKKRIGVSPDNADALALTFAMPVFRVAYTAPERPGASPNASGLISEYNPYAD